MPTTAPLSDREDGARPGRVGAALCGALAEALSLVFPTSCAGCDLPDVMLCAACRADLTPGHLVRQLPDGTPVHSALVFDGTAARVIRALKEDGRTPLARPLGRALQAAAVAAGLAADVQVVAVPASRAAVRRRGYRAVELVAARGHLAPQRLLRAVTGTADQRGLGRAERAGNVAGTMRARGVAGRRILLVDDVVTTGATLAEAARALRDGGADVIGAATIAATPRRGLVTAARE